MLHWTFLISTVERIGKDTTVTGLKRDWNNYVSGKFHDTIWHQNGDLTIYSTVT